MIRFLISLGRVKQSALTRWKKPKLRLLFESLAGRCVFVGKLPVKMQERGSQQTGCLLFTVVQIDSVRPAFEARDPGGLFSLRRPLPSLHLPPPFTLPLPLPWPSVPAKHAWHQQLPLRAVVSFLYQSQASAAMGTSPRANEQHLFLSSVAVHANHNTHFIWPLSCSQSQHVIHWHSGLERHRRKEIFGPSRE